MKKRPFLLLETLIALTLLILCAVPLLVKPIQAYRSEMRLFEEAEGERLADWTFSEIKELLLKNEIPWEALPARNQTSISIPLTDGMIHVPGRAPKLIKRAFCFFGKGEKQGIQGEIFRMIYVKIRFHPELCRRKKHAAYLYRIAVQRLPKIQSKETNDGASRSTYTEYR